MAADTHFRYRDSAVLVRFYTPYMVTALVINPGVSLELTAHPDWKKELGDQINIWESFFCVATIVSVTAHRTWRYCANLYSVGYH